MKRDEIELRDYFRVINKRKWFIVWGTLACVALAALISLFLPRIYESSLILEVGKIYLPPHKEGARQEVEFVEEPEATAEVVKSEDILEQVRQDLGLDLPLRKLRDQIEVSTFMEDVPPTKMGSPLVVIVCESKSPKTAVNILNLIAGIIVAEHNQRYDDNRNALQERVSNLEASSAEIGKVIAGQNKVRRELQEQIKAAHQNIDRREEKIAAIDASEVKPVELLFLDTYGTNQAKTVTTLNESVVEIDYNVANAFETISEFKDQIAILKNLINLSRPTRIRSKAVLPEKPTRPKTWLNIAIGGFVGLVLTVIVTFSGDYLS